MASIAHPRLKALPLRQRKFAATKVGLWRETYERLQDTPFAALQVSELCEALQISQPTFFNYFPRKSDLLVYHIQLWSIAATWHARRLSGQREGLAFIEAMLDWTGQNLEANPHMMMEIISFQARRREVVPIEPLTAAELLTAFPDLEGIEEVEPEWLDERLRKSLAVAKLKGELPPETDLDQAVVAIVSVFFGVPMIFGHSAPERIRGAYQSQLQLIWQGLRAPRSRS